MTMAFTFRQGDLPKLDLQVDRGTDFQAWKQQWQAYFSLSGLDKQPETKQAQALTLCFSRETVSIVDNLGLSVAQRGSVANTIAAIERYVKGQVNETVERKNFRKRVQQDGESFDDFLVALRELSKTCNFCTDECLQKNICDQIIEGLSDGSTVEDLLKEKDLTLDTTIDKCRAHEAAKRQRVEVSSTPAASIQAVQQTPKATTTQTCPGCGSRFHQGGRRNCHAFRVACNNCNKTGHFARVCKSKPTKTRQTPPSDPGTRVIHAQVPSIKSTSENDQQYEPAPTIAVQISTLNGQAVLNALPDSGADISVAGPSVIQQLGEHCNNLLGSNMTPRGVSGRKLTPLGQLPVQITLGRTTHTDNLHIYPNVKGILLSWKAAQALNVLPKDYPSQLPDTRALSLSVNQKPQEPSSDLMSEFPTVFNDQINQMKGEEFHINLTQDAQPFCIKTPRSVPFAYRDKLKEELDHLQAQGIIAPVTHPTEWCAPIVVTPKKDSKKIRLCVDLSHLNRYVKRERYQSDTPAQAVADIAADHAKIFTKLDAMKGYHQCPLSVTSQDLTTFLTPFGRFKFLRAPYGISSISEHYNRRMDEAFSGLFGYRRVVDDIVIYDQDPDKHADHVRQFLQRCSERGITLNRSKWVYAKPSVDFAGFTLSEDGYQVATHITQAIAAFPTPSSRTDLRSFIGLVNQLSSSTNNLARMLDPFRPLLSTKNEFLWSEEFQATFDAIKRTLTTTPILSYFNPEKPTRLCTDASRKGLGFVLQQRDGEQWKLVQAGSRFLSDAESRYAIIELEMLAIAWAVTKCNIFLAGLQQFLVITDHHPLIPILNSHRLDEIENTRLQRLRTKLMRYNFKAEWLKGDHNKGPDALSRYPNSNPLPRDALAESDLDDDVAPTVAHIRTVMAGTHDSIAETSRLQKLQQAAMSDQEYQALKHYVLNGFPKQRHELPEGCRQYWKIRVDLSIEDDLIVYGHRLLIPRAMRRSILQQLHESHQGQVRTKERARLAVYWPSISNDIDNVIMSCKTCQDLMPSHPREPIAVKPPAERPFQEIAIDFCSHAGQGYLIIVDCFSDWPEIVPMHKSTTTPRLTAALRAHFCRTGVPDKIWSDQGPQFSSLLFREFAKQWGFQHITSSPRYPQSNGKAEATVKSMKKLIRTAWSGRSLNEDKLTRSLLQYRNTPSRRDGVSPAQKLFGHPIQDTLPAHRRAFSAEW